MLPIPVPWWIHPAIAIGLVVLSGYSLWLGLQLGRVFQARQAKQLREVPSDRAHDRRRRLHVRLGVATVSMSAMLFALGLLGQQGRDQPVFQTLHGYTGQLVVILFVVQGFLGWRLLRGKEGLRHQHRITAMAAFGAILLQMVTGIALVVEIMKG